ncbi:MULTISPECIES: hypothetical protein [Paraburkholderia]|uniref:Uncharacterized protein n=1 Tax=Paraburkholderia youngii TaxID=2782701 RepID=A0A7W8L7W7_9BURK|nr:hypothetical protein [Paraburkholderia youngii]MBB5401959.1 hypothetical protein [Paraburkholderia youngii]
MPGRITEPGNSKLHGAAINARAIGWQKTRIARALDSTIAVSPRIQTRLTEQIAMEYTRLLRRGELESRPQWLGGLQRSLAFVRYLFDSLSRNFFEEGQASPIVIGTQLCVEHKLFGLKQFHAQVVQRTFGLFLGSRSML